MQTENKRIDQSSNCVVAFNQVSLSYAPNLSEASDSDYVLRGLNFELAEGSFHFLTGPSGAGKTSLLKMIYLAQSPSHGQVSLFGQAIDHQDRNKCAYLRRRIGIVFQDFRLLEHLNVFDNAALPLFVSGQDPKSFKDDVGELLNWVGLKDRLDAMPSALSGGEKQRLAIARAVINRPTLILADEPTGNIDYAMGLRIMRLLLELNRLGATVLIASHDQALIRATGMAVLELNNGQITKRDLNNDLTQRASANELEAAANMGQAL